MKRMGKIVCLLLLLIVTLSAESLIIKPVTAQSMHKPSTPEFTIQTQSQANTTTITLTIRNQPFDAASQYPDGFFYNVAISVDGKNWSELYHVEDAQDWYPQQSNSSTTVLTYVAGETIYYPRDTSQGIGIIPRSGEVAFQVQAMIGHRDRGAFKNGFMPYVFVGETSDWSNTQTITIPESSTSANPSPSVPEFSWLTILPLLLFTPIVLIMIRKRVHKENSNNYSGKC
jgi:hypothetical protein